MESINGIKAIEEEQQKQTLTVKTRQHVISLICDFIQEVFGSQPQPKMIRLTCLEVIEIFPSLKFHPSTIGGIVRIVSFRSFLSVLRENLVLLLSV